MPYCSSHCYSHYQIQLSLLAQSVKFLDFRKFSMLHEVKSLPRLRGFVECGHYKPPYCGAFLAVVYSKDK